MQQHSTVKKLFYEQAEYYSQSDQSASKSPIIPLFLNWAKNKSGRKSLKVCEFGGGGGVLLDSISKRTKLKIELCNAEIVEKYRKYQINSKIKFYIDSILNSCFPDNFFDCVIIRDVLHHLIGGNYQDTQKNQRKALSELKRITKPDGIILIEELVNQSTIAVKIIYWLSRLNNKIGIRSRSFGISPYTIIALLTSRALIKITKEIFGSKNIIQKEYLPDIKKWQAKVTHLGCGSGKFILLIKKT